MKRVRVELDLGAKCGTVDYHLSGISLMWNFPDFEKWNLFHISGILRVRYIPY